MSFHRYHCATPAHSKGPVARPRHSVLVQMAPNEMDDFAPLNAGASIHPPPIATPLPGSPAGSDDRDQEATIDPPPDCIHAPAEYPGRFAHRVPLLRFNRFEKKHMHLIGLFP